MARSSSPLFYAYEANWNGPTGGDFDPGVGLSTLTRTNATAIDAVIQGGGTHHSDWGLEGTDAGTSYGTEGVDVQSGLGQVGEYQANTRAHAHLGDESSWFGGNPIMLVFFIAIGFLLVHKFWSERHTSAHVADVRISATQFLILPIFLVAGIWFWSWMSGIASGYGVPGARSAAAFFSLGGGS